MASPVVAAERRSCHFVVEVNPTDDGLEHVIYSFRVFNTVGNRFQFNDARRVIRRRVIDCVLAHWNDRNETPPYACRDWGRVEMSEYPFQNIYEEMRQRICETNRDELRLPVNIEMFIRGRRGCLERDEERGVVDPAVRISIASNFEFNCPAREGSRFEMIPAPPDTPPLLNIRLPGNDLRDIGPQHRQAETWQECWRRCEYNDDCRAWTFRAAGTSGTGSAALCLQKSGVTIQVPDTCCQSGIKE